MPMFINEVNKLDEVDESFGNLAKVPEVFNHRSNDLKSLSKLSDLPN